MHFCWGNFFLPLVLLLTNRASKGINARHMQPMSRAVIDCSWQNFKTHNLNCCLIPGMDLFTEQQLAECSAPYDKNTIKWANNYMLNKLQVFRNGNNIELGDWKISLKTCNAANFLNCVYEKNGLLLADGSVNMDSFVTLFNQTQDEEFWRTAISLALPRFDTLVNTLMPDSVKILSCPGENKNVSAIPLVWTQIVNGAFITQCPISIPSGNCKQMSVSFNSCIQKVENFILGQQGSRRSASRENHINFYEQKYYNKTS